MDAVIRVIHDDLTSFDTIWKRGNEIVKKLSDVEGSPFYKYSRVAQKHTNSTKYLNDGLPDMVSELVYEVY